MLKIKASPQNKVCSQCNAVLACGSAQAGESCWCVDYPAMLSADSTQDCLCADCLSIAIQKKIAEFINISSQQERIAVARKYRNDKLIQGIDYLIENDQYIFTAWYHLKRGSCCENGCRNCPY